MGALGIHIDCIFVSLEDLGTVLLKETVWKFMRWHRADVGCLERSCGFSGHDLLSSFAILC